MLNHRYILLAVAASATTLMNVAAAQTTVADGTAIVRVITVPPGTPGNFRFAGIPRGSLSNEGSLRVSGLRPGTYTSNQIGAGPLFMVTDVRCDDQDSDAPSGGEVLTNVVSTATFHIEAGETVTCTFTNVPVPSSGYENRGPASENADPCSAPGFENFRVPGELPASAGAVGVPKASGRWDVTNFAGQMACAGFNAPLAASRETGVLEVRDGGQTLVGTGFAEGTLPITMHAVPGITGRYAGSVGGSKDGIPMTINFCWQVLTDEWITGFLRSEVSTQGVTCKMSRDSELKYAGP
jgi:hypothetical protein